LYLQQISCTQASAHKFLDWHLFYYKHTVRSESLSRIAAKEKATSSLRSFQKLLQKKRGQSVWGQPAGSVCVHVGVYKLYSHNIKLGTKKKTEKHTAG